MNQLTEKQKAFCREYLKDFNASRACRAAGYGGNNINRIASQNLSNEKIKAYLTELIGQRSARTEITADRVLQELAYIAFFDIRKLFNDDGTLKEPHELDEDTARAISAIESANERTKRRTKDVEITEYIKKIKALDKKGALELLGKHLGMFADIIKIEDANAEFEKYLAELYDAFSPEAKAEFRTFVSQRDSGVNLQPKYGAN